jgi:hypothetical protein
MAQWGCQFAAFEVDAHTVSVVRADQLIGGMELDCIGNSAETVVCRVSLEKMLHALAPMPFWPPIVRSALAKSLQMAYVRKHTHAHRCF